MRVSWGCLHSEIDPEVLIETGHVPALVDQLAAELQGSNARVKEAALTALNQLSAACRKQRSGRCKR